MATVSVNSWSEFAAAVAVTGDTVVCPEGAVWDMNEIAPDGVPGLSIASAEVRGNGTEIRNLRVTSSNKLGSNVDFYQSITALHFTNFVCESGQFFSAGGVQRGGSRTDFTGCKFSGLLPQNARFFCAVGGNYGDTRPTHFAQCAFTIEFGYNASTATQITSNGTIKYCRMHIQLPNGALFYPGASWSYVRIDCPAMTRLNVNGAAANVYDGDLPQLTGATGTASATYPSVYNKDSMPNFAGAANVIGVTGAQLRDPAYLSSIGFPIGVEA